MNKFNIPSFLATVWLLSYQENQSYTTFISSINGVYKLFSVVLWTIYAVTQKPSHHIPTSSLHPPQIFVGVRWSLHKESSCVPPPSPSNSTVKYAGHGDIYRRAVIGKNMWRVLSLVCSSRFWFWVFFHRVLPYALDYS